MREDRNLSFFTQQDTLFMKGIALLLLLWHHLFLNVGDYDDVRWGDCFLVGTIASYCKLCVALFVFLSAYGLTCKAMNARESLVLFYRRRLIKLLMNYWMIFALFGTLGILTGWRSLISVYGDNIIPHFIYDVFGLFYAITGHAGGYNPTWWFMSCIIVLYLLFPLLYRFRRCWFLFVPGSIILYVYGWKIPILCSCHADMITFIMGMYCACLFEKKIVSLPFGVWFYAALFIVASIVRFYIIWPLAWDSVICVSAILLYN